MLKKIRLIIILILLAAFSNIGLPYEIELKNGTIINAEDLWEENGKVFYHKHGVVVSIEKSNVKEIKGSGEEPEEISVNSSGNGFSDNPKIAGLDKKISELDLSIREWRYEKGQVEWDRKRVLLNGWPFIQKSSPNKSTIPIS